MQGRDVHVSRPLQARIPRILLEGEVHGYALDLAPLKAVAQQFCRSARRLIVSFQDLAFVDAPVILCALRDVVVSLGDALLDDW